MKQEEIQAIIENRYSEDSDEMKDIDVIISTLDYIGLVRQEKEEHCSFKIVINNCNNTEYYFRPKKKKDSMRVENEVVDKK